MLQHSVASIKCYPLYYCFEKFIGIDKTTMSCPTPYTKVYFLVHTAPPHHWAARRPSGWVRRAHCRAPRCPPCGPMPNPTVVQLIASVLTLFVYCYILVNKHVQLRSWVSLDDGPSVLVTWSQRLRSEAASPKRLLATWEDRQ